MKYKICYNITKLMKLLPNHEFRRVNFVQEGEEYYDKGDHLSFVSPDVSSVHVWFGLLGNSMTVSLTNGEDVKLHSNTSIHTTKHYFASEKLIILARN